MKLAGMILGVILMMAGSAYAGCTSNHFGSMETVNCDNGYHATVNNFGSMSTISDNQGGHVTCNTFGSMTTCN